METTIKSILAHSNRILVRILVACLLLPGTAVDIFAAPDEWLPLVTTDTLTTWNFYEETIAWDDVETEVTSMLTLGCFTEVNISIGLYGYSVIKPYSLVNAPVYPQDQYDVDIMGPLNDTVYCAQIGQELMVVVTELPTGNSCMTIVNVEDKLKPVFHCAPDIVPCNVDIASLNFEDYLEPVVDNCDMNLTLTSYYMVQNLPCNPNHFSQQILVTWTATDDSGNSATCVDTLFLLRPYVDQIHYPADVTIPCLNANTDPSNTGVPTYNNEPIGLSCQYSVTYTDKVIQMCNGSYKIERKWKVWDLCNLVPVYHTQNIMVVDNVPPVITCPTNITIGTDFGFCTRKYTFPNPPVTDACADDNLIVVQFTVYGMLFPYVPGEMVTLGLGTTQITVRAIDPCGNQSTCHYNVTVIDNTPPVITCPPNTTVDCTGSIDPAFTGMATATDNCDPNPLVTYTDMTAETQGCALGYKITRTWKATDNGGNSTSCMQMIVFTDMTPPSISCPVNVTIECTASTAPANTGSATATDLCDDAPDITYSDITTGGACPQAYTISRTWMATDDCGNSSTCLQLILVDDTVAPGIMCPTDVTIECTEIPLPGLTGMATATDNCDPNPVITYSDINVPGALQTYTINRTWEATDGCGNSSTCLQLILVRDETPPVITCPSNVTIECTESTLPENTGMAAATDNCDATPGITYSDQTVGGACPQESTITRTWMATDACGNTSTCIQTIVVDDSTAPVITFCASNITIECDESTDPSNTGTTSATDNCDSAPVVTYDDSIAPGACPQESTITRTWTATDACGNTSTCVQVITVDDSTPPVITGCPLNVTIECDESTDPLQTGMAVASDNCDAAPQVNHDDAIAPGVCPQESVITRTWTATDACGNATNCIQIITVQDNTPPTITLCPPNVTIECTESTGPGNTGMATATDNCDTNPTITFNDSVAPGSCPQESTITRTWTTTDACGNATNCIQVIVVDDSTPPTITLCPANVTIECVESTDPSNTGIATASDNCDVAPVVTYSETIIGGACPQESTITRTWLATDACGNTSTCSQTIFVDDSTAPQMTCPSNMTIECTASTHPDNTGFASATDNCDAAPVVTFNDVTAGGACPQESTITRTWTATDACGNSTNCVQLIVVDDSQAPIITCPGNMTIQCTDSTLPAATGTATASDNCDAMPAVNFSDVTMGGACPQELTITRTWTATDACGNSSSCIQTITVDDSQAPAITCPGNISIECTESSLPDNTGFASATDNCTATPDITFSDVTVGGDCPLLLTITRTWTASDGCGNSTACVQIIIVSDDTDPVITCPDDVNIQCDESSLPDNTGSATASDACDISPEVTYSDVTAGIGCPLGYQVTRTWVATDDCGHTSTCVQVITIDDNTAPAISCPANMTIECNESTSPENTGFATSTDNCDAMPTVDFSDITAGNGCPEGYTITRTWTAIDECGNIGSCIQIIVVDDNLAPAISCPANVTIECTASSDPANTGTAGATDICDATPTVDFTDAITNGACPQEFTITRTWSATDDCGNTGTCNQIIVVEDTTPPVCQAMNITVALDGSGMITINGSQVDAGSTDNCGPVGLSVLPNMFDCTNLGDNPVVLTVTDCPGNSSTCTAIVTIEDNGGLQAMCQNVTIFLDANGNASVDPADIDNGSGGGCAPGMLEFDLSQTNFNCTDLGPNIVTLTVSDQNGNTATCTATVTVVDQMPPVITCPQDLPVECNTLTNPDNTAQFGSATATDNCPPATVTETHVLNLNSCGVGTIVRTFTATDGSGNTATCVQTVTVTNSNPLDEGDITWPNSPVSVNICGSTDPEDIPNGVPVINPAVLSCANPVTTYVDAVEMFVDNNPNTTCKVITRTWTIVDDCQPNGTFMFVQTINVEDAVAPHFTNINDMTKVANSNCVAHFTLIASATDCGGVSITNNSPYGQTTGANASGDYPIGVTVVIFTATDGCGNISTMDVVITVTDPNPTIFICDKQILYLTEEGEVTVTADTFVHFDVGNCTDENDFIVSFSGTDPFDTLRTYDCGDVGVHTFSLWLWTIDGTMIEDTCNTADLDLREGNYDCQPGILMFGGVENEEGLAVSGVEVSILNAPMRPDTTDQNGQYLIKGLTPGQGYRVAPFDDHKHREGVSTLDLVLIQKHLLGKAKLSSPYKIIAADANKSGTVTALDLLEIRKLILGIINRFPNNTSWRFIDSKYTFADPYNPFTPVFPESVWVDSITGAMDTANFVGIKIGDVNGSFFKSRATGEEITPRSNTSVYGLSVKRIMNPANKKYEWSISALPGQGKIDGMQFSLYTGRLAADQIENVFSEVLADDHWSYNPETQMINVSWSSDDALDLSDRVLLKLPDPGMSLDLAVIDDTFLEPEVYVFEGDEILVRKVSLSASGPATAKANEYNLFQNIPNPFSENTSIRFSLPREEMVTLAIHDISGRLMYRQVVNGVAGINEVLVNKQDIGAPGIYYYTLYTLNATFTHKMSLSTD